MQAAEKISLRRSWDEIWIFRGILYPLRSTLLHAVTKHLQLEKTSDALSHRLTSLAHDE